MRFARDIRFAAALLLLLTSCSPARTTPRQDGARPQPDTRPQIVPIPDRGTPPGPRPIPDATVDATRFDVGLRVTCPAPCPPQHDCRAVFPNTTAGICLKRCSAGCSPPSGKPSGGPAYTMCQVVIAATRYCMDFCYWKEQVGVCRDLVNQTCVDAYSIPNGLLPPGYPGSSVCVPK